SSGPRPSGRFWRPAPGHPVARWRLVPASRPSGKTGRPGGRTRNIYSPDNSSWPVSPLFRYSVQKLLGSCRSHFPQTDGIVRATGQYPPAVRRWGDGQHRIVMDLETVQKTSRLQIPQANATVITPRQRAPAVGQEPNGSDIAGMSH